MEQPIMADEETLANRLKVRHPELTTQEANEDIKVAEQSALSFFYVTDSNGQSTSVGDPQETYEINLAANLQEYMDPSGAYQLPGVPLAPIRKKKE